MRNTLVLGFAILMAHDVAGADKPIPQDPAKIEKRRLDRLEWLHRTFTGAYDNVGKKDPSWDKQVREAMDLSERQTAKFSDRPISHEEINKLTKAAIDAGCDDPLVIHLYNVSSTGPNFPGKEEARRRFKASGEALGASRYPAFRRANALELAGSYPMYDKVPTEDDLKAAKHNYDEALALLPESVKTDERNEFWEERWIETLGKLIQGYRKLGDDVLDAHKRVDEMLAKIPEMKVLRLQIRGIVYTSIGWQARTNAFASRVPAKAAETFLNRLTDAREAYEEAWRIQPSGARTARAMLEIEKSIGGDRAEMEKWFERAMEADGDNRDACWAKLDWLDPKWYGTPEEMLAFGSQCRDTKNWRAGITLLYCDSLLRMYCILPTEKKVGYLYKPEYWAGIKAVFDEYLEHFPDDVIARSKYAVMCRLAVHSLEAHVQFEILGDRLTQWTEFPYFPMETMKEMREYARTAAANEPKPVSKPDNKGTDATKPR
jgi:tetratricopeptide (TPR) repeat protein